MSASDDEDAFAVFNHAVAPAPIDLASDVAVTACAVDTAKVRMEVPRSGADVLTRKLQDASPGAGAAASHGMTFLHGDNAAPMPSPRPRTEPSKVVEESNSGIRVRRVTRSMEQLSVWLAQYPFVSFHRARDTLLRHRPQPSFTLAQTCVGVVTRKSEPKPSQRGGSPYAVVTLWNLTGISPVATEELALLLSGAAFDRLYTQLLVGVVVAVSNLCLLPDRRDGTTTNSLLLRPQDVDAVRVLGLAVDLGTCAAVQRRSTERCGALVNTRRSATCVYHLRDPRRAGSGPSHPAPRVPSMTLPLHRPVTTTRPVAPGQPWRPNFLTVHGVTGLPVKTAEKDVMDGTGVYAGVCRGTALALSGPVHPLLPTRVAGGTLGQHTLLVAQRQCVAQERRRLLEGALREVNSVPSLHKRARQGGDAEGVVAAVKAQCAPLPQTTASTCAIRRPRRDLKCGKAADDAALARAGAESVLVREVTRALGAESAAATGHATTWRRLARVGTSKENTPRCVEEAQTVATTQSLTALGAVAAQLDSSQGHLRIEAEVNRVNAFLDRQSAQEKAIEALASVTERSVRAVYCHACQAWYLKPPNSCTEGAHRVEVRTATKRYIQCEHCGYKTFVIGDTVKPWRMLPRCPRCNAQCVWNASNAAPELPATGTDVPHPY